MPNLSRATARARALRAKHGFTETLTIDVNRIARLEGVAVESADLGSEISGLLVRQGDRAIIGVNARHAATRQRFTVAHELGHYILHKHGRELFVDEKYVAHFRDENSSAGFDPQEIEANQFAAELLMPMEHVREYFIQNPFDINEEQSLNDLARAFGVSSIAMAIRLSNLRLAIGAY